jgi:hypothetical protein
MKLHLAQLPRLIAERRSTAIFGVVIIAMLWAASALNTTGFAGRRAQAERTNRNFAMVFEENVLRSSARSTNRSCICDASSRPGGHCRFHTIVSTTDILSEIIVQVAIIDARNHACPSNAGPQPAPVIDLSDREHYRAHLDRTDDRLFISKPVVGRASKKWSVQFTRRFLDRDGKFAGVVVASLNPEHLTDFYNRIDFGSSTSIALIGADGVVRSSGGGSRGFELGQDLGDSTMFRRAQSATNSTFEDVDSTTGQSRLVTFRQVRGHPLIVSVGIDSDDISRLARRLPAQWPGRAAADIDRARSNGADPGDGGEGPSESQAASAHAGKYEPRNHAGHQRHADSDHQLPMRGAA